MGDETTENSETSRGVIFGFVLSVALIVAPFILWITGAVMPQLMLGLFIGATVRFGTDALIMVQADGAADDWESFAGSNMVLIIGCMLLQFGTLIGGAFFWFTTGSIIGAGIVAAMLVAYLYGGLMRFTGGSEGTIEVDEDDDESEWQFDADDVGE